MESYEERVKDCKARNVPMALLFHDGSKCHLTGLPCVSERTTSNDATARLMPVEYPLYWGGDCRVCIFAMSFIMKEDNKS